MTKVVHPMIVTEAMRATCINANEIPAARASMLVAMARASIVANPKEGSGGAVSPEALGDGFAYHVAADEDEEYEHDPVVDALDES